MRRSAISVLALAMAPGLPAWAASAVAVEQLAKVVASARASGSSDERTAEKIARLDLKERLTPATLARLASGVGERTAAALELLADRSAILDPPSDEIDSAPPPSPAEQHAIVERAEDYTFAYVKDLPNIVCARVVSRFDDLVASYSYGRLGLYDTLIGELTVRDGAESFHIQNAGILIATANGVGDFEQTPNDYASSGEFGGVLAEPFAGQAAFAWRRWETVDGKRVAVVAYSVPRERSLFTVSWCCTGPVQSRQPFRMKSAFRGEMSIDPESGAIVRITQQAVDLPEDFPVRHAWNVVEYRPVTLAGGVHLLPARSLSFMDVLPPLLRQEFVFTPSERTPDHQHYLNRLEFRNYRKFAAESKLAFDTAPDSPLAPVATARATSLAIAPAPAPPSAAASAGLPEAPPIPTPPAVESTLMLSSNRMPPLSPPQPTPGATGETPGSEPVFRVRRNEIPVRVVVRDERGDAVGDLRQGDFEVFDNGKRQQISGFRVESCGAASVPRETSAQAAKSSTLLQVQPAPLPGHYVVLLFDDVQLTLADLYAMRTAAKRAVKDIVEPGTRVALLTQTGKQYLDFTDDVEKLNNVLDHIRSQIVTNDSQASSTFAWLNMPTDAARKAGATGSVSPSQGRFGVGATASQTPPGTGGFHSDSVAFGKTGDYSRYRPLLKAIETAVSRLAVMPGDRSVVYVSPGFIVSPEDQREYWELIDRAARKGIPISTLDTRGLWTLPEFSAEQTMVQDPTHESGRNTHENELRQGLYLRGLADGTGGIAVENSNDFNRGFKRIAMRPEFTYLLTFSPPDLVPDGKYHKLKVDVRDHPGVTVQARDGYLAPDKMPTEAEQAAREIEDAIFSRDEIREIPLSVRVEPSAQPAALSANMNIGLSTIRFAKEDGHSRASLIATVGLFDANGNYTDGKQDKLDLDYPDAKLPAALATGLDVRSDFNVAPGSYLVRIVVRDADGHVASTNQTVELR